VTQTYRDILTRLPGGNKILESAYEAVELTIASVKNYVDEWLRYQALWDLQVCITSRFFVNI
jgi:dynein heavy chain 1